MSTITEYADASPEVRAVYDDIMLTRRVDQMNNLWKCWLRIRQPCTALWGSLKEIMAPSTAGRRL